MTLLILPARADHDLQWDREKERARKALSEGKSICWELDFGPCPSLFDPASFALRRSTIDHFVKDVFEMFKGDTSGVILYRQSGDLLSSVVWSAEEEEKYLEWAQDLRVEEAGTHEKRVFCIDLLTAYLHRLVSLLPEALPAFAAFDASYLKSEAEVAQLFSLERFSHLEPLIAGKRDLMRKRGAQIAAQVAVCLPNDAHCTAKIRQRLDRQFAELDREGVAFRVIPESLLNEQWDGIETLVVVKEGVSSQGKRMLQGFEASGGSVKTIGAEGFEPPTHCSQSSCASQTALCSD
jgi:hypothetical protein